MITDLELEGAVKVRVADLYLQVKLDLGLFFTRNQALEQINEANADMPGGEVVRWDDRLRN